MNKTWIIVLAVAAVLLFWGIGSYNGLVNANEQVDAQWAQVETQYQRRFDLVPNLVETVKGVAAQERGIIEDITNARTQYAGARGAEDRAQAANNLESALGRLLVISENYPQLRASESFLQLQNQLEGAENRISVERSRYNEAVRDYNVKVKRFPSNIFAGMFGFDARTPFKSVEEAATPPAVDFDENK
jgi:LemA protein